MLTKYLAKVMGLWIVLAVLGMFITPQPTMATINAFFADPPVLWVTGIFTMLIGLIVVVVHNRWSGGALPVIVTLYGWIALIKGMTLVWLPAASQAAGWQALHFDRFYYGYLAIALIIGAYLTYGGFTKIAAEEASGTGAAPGSPPSPPAAGLVPPHGTTWPTVPNKPKL